MCIRDRYNHVINCYNSMENRVAEIYLKKMAERKYYNTFVNLFRTIAKRLILYLIALIVPLTGFAILVWQIYCYLFYLKSRKLFEENQRLVSDPFVNMIFAPELCRITNSINHYYQVEIKDVEGFSFNKEIKNKLTQKAIQGKVKFMVYNDRFYNFYTNFPRYNNFHVWEIIKVSVLTLLNLVFLHVIDEISEDQNGSESSVFSPAITLNNLLFRTKKKSNGRSPVDR
eukprot:TRINITY_DN26990_c0_g1_i1.p1 TRINITY_DN26990_c0_g1~~TRINITY_DN26990_c0_g1_i1.p1  ORF type:complete len:228 (-),score=47.43 TRINITY_DN26990_c0_g1_i1:152-835(-)